MIRTLLVAGLAAFIGKKLYDNGTLTPYIEEARKRLNSARSDAGSAPSQQTPEMDSTPSAPVVSTPPYRQIPAG